MKKIALVLFDASEKESVFNKFDNVVFLENAPNEPEFMIYVKFLKMLNFTNEKIAEMLEVPYSSFYKWCIGFRNCKSANKLASKLLSIIKVIDNRME